MPRKRNANRLLSILAVSLLATAAAPAPVSDPIGVYAIIDRVVVTTDPATIQLWGVFALSPGQSGDLYQPAQRGYMYFRERADADARYNVELSAARTITRTEWNDIRAVAGTGQMVGFGSRYIPTGRVRPASEVPVAPDAYPIGYGMVKAPGNHLAPSVARELASVPLPVSPEDGATLKAGQVRLVVRNVADPAVRYVFSVDGQGQHETSDALEAGKEQTTWTPKLVLREGQDYIWRVRVTKDGWGSQAASSTVHVVK